MSDNLLLRVHWWGMQARRVSLAAFAGFAWLALAEDWPRWALWLTVVPAAVVLFVAAWVVVPACRWLEDRRGWDEPAEVIW